MAVITSFFFVVVFARNIELLSGGLKGTKQNNSSTWRCWTETWKTHLNAFCIAMDGWLSSVVRWAGGLWLSLEHKESVFFFPKQFTSTVSFLWFDSITMIIYEGTVWSCVVELETGLGLQVLKGCGLFKTWVYFNRAGSMSLTGQIFDQDQSKCSQHCNDMLLIILQQ